MYAISYCHAGGDRIAAFLESQFVELGQIVEQAPTHFAPKPAGFEGTTPGRHCRG